MLVICIALLAALFLLLQYTAYYVRLWKFAKNLPDGNLSKLPFIGHAHHILSNIKNVVPLYSTIAEGPSPATYWLGPVLLVAVTDPDDVHSVLKSSHLLSKSSFYKFLKASFGTSMITAPVSEWKSTRQLMTASLTNKALDSYIKTFNSYVDKFIFDLSGKQEMVFDAFEVIAPCSLAATFDTILGVRAAPEEVLQFYRASTSLLETIVTRMKNFYMHPELLFRFTKTYREYRNSTKTMEDFILKAVIQQRQLLSENKVDNFLHQYLEKIQHEPCDDDLKVVQELKFLLVAAYNTITRTLSYLLLVLGMHPEIQEKLLEEAKMVLENRNDLEAADLAKLVYLEMTIKETLRLFPPGALIAREVCQDTSIGSYTIPRGAQILINIFGMQRSHKYHKHPLTFMPERFSVDQTEKGRRYDFVPFSFGPRNCFGHQFAWRFMKVFVAKFVLNYRVESRIDAIEDVRFKTDLFLAPAEGFPIKVLCRK